MTAPARTARAAPGKESALSRALSTHEDAQTFSASRSGVNGSAPIAGDSFLHGHEATALSWLMNGGAEARKELAEFTEQHFVMPANRSIFRAYCAIANVGTETVPDALAEELNRTGELAAVGGKPAMISLWLQNPRPAQVRYAVSEICRHHLQRRQAQLAERMLRRDVTPEQACAELQAIISDEQRDDRAELETILASRRFDAENPPLPALPRFKVENAVISTPANLTAIQAQAKSGKTAFLTGMMGATMAPTGDCLGVTADNPHGLAVVHLDTEQSPADHHAVLAGALRRAGRTSRPDWLRSYRLADVPLAIRQQIIVFEMERAAKECGGVYCLLLDGVADFCVDPNDPAEAFPFVDDLHQLAIRFETSIVAVIHENPSSELGKTRGHLGSQLERKAETNLRLSKDGDGVTTVFADRARHAHIPKEHGSRFVWSEEERMHVSTDAPAKGRPKAFEPDEILELMGGEWMTFAEAFARCSEGGGWKQTSFKHAWKQLKTSGQLVESVMEKGKWGSKCS